MAKVWTQEEGRLGPPTNSRRSPGAEREPPDVRESRFRIPRTFSLRKSPASRSPALRRDFVFFSDFEEIPLARGTLPKFRPNSDFASAPDFVFLGDLEKSSDFEYFGTLSGLQLFAGL